MNTINQEHQEGFINYLREYVNIDSLYQKYLQQLPNKECPICYDNFRPEDLLECRNGHTAACYRCLQQLQEPICPVCREDLPIAVPPAQPTIEAPPAQPTIEAPPAQPTILTDRRVDLPNGRSSYRQQYLGIRTNYANVALVFHRSTPTMLVYRSPYAYNERLDTIYYIEIKKSIRFFNNLRDAILAGRTGSDEVIRERQVLYRTYKKNRLGTDPFTLEAIHGQPTYLKLFSQRNIELTPPQMAYRLLN